MTQPSMQRLFHATQGWYGHTWQSDLSLAVDGDGRLASAAPDEAGEALGRWVLPGMPNLHSHAFQRAMAGLAERRGPGNDSFWTWREAMYRFAAALDPESLQAIAAQLYA